MRDTRSPHGPALSAVLAACLLVSGCGHSGSGRAEAAAAIDVPEWRSIATQADRARIRTWRESWTRALAKVTSAGAADQLAVQGALLQPDAALPNPSPPPGEYRCRTIKLGATVKGGDHLIAYPSFACRVALEKDLLSLAKLDGSQRPVGLLFPGRAERMIFLGTMMLGDETRALEYGRDPERDMVGALERVGPRQWRLVLPWPRWESTLDVIELVPRS